MLTIRQTSDMAGGVRETLSPSNSGSAETNFLSNQNLGYMGNSYLRNHRNAAYFPPESKIFINLTEAKIDRLIPEL